MVEASVRHFCRLFDSSAVHYEMFVGVVVGLPLMRRIMLQIFFIGVWLLSFETYDLQQFRLLNLIVRLALAL